MQAISKSLLLSFWAVIAAVWLPSQAAAIERPEVMLERVTDQTLHALKANKQNVTQNPRQLYTIVDDIIVPHVDSRDMARWVVGRQSWREATPEQRKAFTNAFQELLIKTYASSLLEYSNQRIEYLPIRGSIEGRSRVQVSSVIKETGREPLNVAYRLVRRDSGWKLYDIIIEGVSLLKGFQSQFSNEIRQKGIDKVTADIHQLNRK